MFEINDYANIQVLRALDWPYIVQASLYIKSWAKLFNEGCTVCMEFVPGAVIPDKQ